MKLSVEALSDAHAVQSFMEAQYGRLDGPG
jgi:hypothetical protein